MKIAILGWGSLLWDKRKDFEDQISNWEPGGPSLRLEFSRVSESRGNALTLVVDSENGTPCEVSYTFSGRSVPEDAICDLRCREGTTLKNIGFYFADSSKKNARDASVFESIKRWADSKDINVVVWTDLISNFKEKSTFKVSFSLENAVKHIQSLPPEGKAKAAEYVYRAPEFVNTPLRRALQREPWFSQLLD